MHLERFTAVIDLTFDAEGNLYVLEFAANGLLGVENPAGNCGCAVIRVTPDGDRETVREGESLILPGSVAMTRNSDIYVSNNSIDPMVGEAVRLP